MKMKKILSICALAVTITSCASMSVFAAEYAGNRKEAAKQIAIHAYKGDEVVKGLGITVDTPVKNYVKPVLVQKLIDTVNNGIADESVKNRVVDTIKKGYLEGSSVKEIFEELSFINAEDNIDITTDSTFKAAKQFMQNLLDEFVTANEKGILKTRINAYFKVDSLNGNLTFGKNAANRRVVTLEKNGQVILQVSSENVFNVKSELENNIKSWADLKDYFNKINK